MRPSSDPSGSITVPEDRLARPRTRRLLRWLIGMAVFFVVAIGLGFLAVPPLVKSKLESELSTALDRRTTVERVAFNPFTLTATIEGLLVRNRGADTPLFGLGTVVANLSTESLWRRAPVIDALSVRAPEIHLVRNDDGTYNVQDLIDAFVAAPPGPPPAFSINNIDVSEGLVEFDDRPVRRKHRVDDIAVGLPYLSSLPYETEVKVAPVLKARVNGTPLALTGESTPFADSRESTLDIDVDRLALPVYLDYVPGGLPVRVASGELTTRFKLTFVDGDAKTRALRVAGGFSITDLAVNAPDGTRLATVPAMGFGLEKLDVYAKTVEIGQIAFERPELGVHRNADGSFDFGLPAAAATRPPTDAAAPPVAARVAPAPAAGGAAAERPWRFRLAEARVAGARLRVEDATTTPAFQAVATDIALTANDLSNDAKARGRVALSFNTDLGGSASAEGEVGLEPLTVRGKLDGKGVDLRRLFPYYASALNLEVGEGTLDFAAGFDLARRSPDSTTVTLADGAATIRNLRLLLPGEREPLWTVPEIVASGIAVDVDRRSLTIDELTGRRPSARLRREADGTIDWARLLRTDATTGTGASEPTWQLAINRAALERTTLEFEDRTVKPPVKLRFSELDIRGQDYTNARGKQGTLDVASRVGTAGRIKASGPWTTNPFTARWRVDATGVALAPLQPYLAPHVNATVTSGAATASGALVIDASAGEELRAAYTGEVGITDFASIDPLTASDLVEWKTLRLTGVAATLAPFKLGLGAVALDSFYARVIVYADGTVNLTRLLASSSESAEPPPAPPASSPAGGTSAATVPERKELPVTIGRIQLANGNVQYSDFFIRPNYSANLTEVAGSISAMSAQQAGDIAITASLDHSAPVEIRGRINPFAAELDLDLTGKARDIDLPPLTPYSAKYAGYGIEKGKLSFDVHYKVVERRLTAENQIVLDQLTFGERVESPSATRLPVLLAVALLKDRRGVIDIRLPISGSLDDPEFSVGGLIVQVIVNLLTKAVTAPFALIGAVFAGSGGESAWVEFAPGRADLTPATQAKVATLAKALADRPQLKLEITGRYDAASDAPALRRLAVDRAVKAEKRRVLAEEGTAPLELDDVVVAAEEYPRYLEAAYKRASFDKPKNALGFVTTLPAPEMEALLLQHAAAGDDALRDLANARAQAVKAAIEKNGEVADARLFLLAPRAGSEGSKEGGTPNRVDFALR